MLITTITLCDGKGNQVTIPTVAAPTVKREIGPDGYIADCVLRGTIGHGAPITVDILLRTDGTWDHWATRYEGDNQCLHIERESRGPATEAQRRTVARWYLGVDPRPYGLCPGGTLCKWAFAGLAPDEVSRMYGDGSPVYLA